MSFWGSGGPPGSQGGGIGAAPAHGTAPRVMATEQQGGTAQAARGGGLGWNLPPPLLQLLVRVRNS